MNFDRFTINNAFNTGLNNIYALDGRCRELRNTTRLHSVRRLAPVPPERARVRTDDVYIYIYLYVYVRTGEYVTK